MSYLNYVYTLQRWWPWDKTIICFCAVVGFNKVFVIVFVFVYIQMRCWDSSATSPSQLSLWIFTPMKYHLMTTSPSMSHPRSVLQWTARLIDNSPHGQLASWTDRLIDSSPHTRHIDNSPHGWLLAQFFRWSTPHLKLFSIYIYCTYCKSFIVITKVVNGNYIWV